MLVRRLLPVLVLAFRAVPASAGAALPVGVEVSQSAAAEAATSSAELRVGRVIRTRRSWECRGRLR
jgi:hypothetical protein